jgi:hypothetical protein
MKREYDFSKGKRGAVIPVEPGKTRVTIRIDTRVLDYFRRLVNEAGGGNYQTLINDALREYIEGSRLETVVREAVRKEFKAATGKSRRRTHVQRSAASA